MIQTRTTGGASSTTRRRAVFSAALAGFAVGSACGHDPGTSDEDSLTSSESGGESSGSTSALTTGTGNSPTSTSEPIPEFGRFGVFHEENRVVGYQNPSPLYVHWAAPEGSTFVTSTKWV
jgi:hypothetical protein